MAELANEMLRLLRTGRPSVKDLKNMVNRVVELDKVGLRPTDGFPLGTLNPDAVLVRGQVHPDKLGTLVDLLRQDRGLKEIRLFPRGVLPLPLSFDVDVTLRY